MLTSARPPMWLAGIPSHHETHQPDAARDDQMRIWLRGADGLYHTGADGRHHATWQELRARTDLEEVVVWCSTSA